MNIEELNNLLSTIKNPTIGKALLATYHKLNNCNYKKVVLISSNSAFGLQFCIRAQIYAFILKSRK